jgi:RHS repeat-associated protein
VVNADPWTPAQEQAPQSVPGTGSGQSSAPPSDGGPSAPPSVSLPKGGAAIRGIGEKFTVNAATGTASLAIPVATSPGRAGFGPSLSLTYSSGAGNSPFGLGWTVLLPSITRKTDRGLPRYHDDPDQDTFILSGAEDLVPVREERDGAWEQVPERQTADGRDYLVQRYRPRIEGLFARIERWRDLDSGETHWRTISSGNVTTLYGATAGSQIADPDDPARVFSWLICASYDDTGNAAAYEYRAENTAGIDTARASERNRTERSRSAGRYPKRIRYGNRVPVQADDGRHRTEPAGHEDWMFEVVFDYGDHDRQAPRPEPDTEWPCRPDPFSTYRPGFEVRTYRRCHRVLMFHHFPDEPAVGASCLVSATDIRYKDVGGSGMTSIASVARTGYRRRDDGGYRHASLPPTEFGYRTASIASEPYDVGREALENLPVGISPESGYEWVDLDGEGLSGILTRSGDAWFYKDNLGDGRFGPARRQATQPSLAGTAGRLELLDLAGSGHLDLVEFGSPTPGFYERTDERGWQEFRSFRSHPQIAWDDPDLRMVDLDGDGLADILITRDDAFSWHPSLGRAGFGSARRTFQSQDEERGPRLLLADPEQTIYLADMSGDGLADLVRVRNGEICYWPNTGFSRFGAKVTMDRCPWLDGPGHFDQRRVRLADVDGSGTADLIYLGADETRLYLNQSGNGYSEPRALPQGFPRLDALAQVMVADLLGRGTACLVWSSPLPGDMGRQLRYLDLMAAGKPYLLTNVVNNLGAETKISYVPSTRFYLADKEAGRPWITRLPFPVQVVERVETIDRVGHNRYVNRYSYHHGYFDSFEREFRGFGLVEQYDTEELAALDAAATAGQFDNQDPVTNVPPVLTRTWLHTGVFPDGGFVSRLFEHEYYRPPGARLDLPDTRLPDTLRPTGAPPRPWRLSSIEAREACRALSGAPLRQEVYALDGSDATGRPYLVTEYNYAIDLLQPALTPQPEGPQNYHAILITSARETVTAHYERAVYLVGGQLRADPRITHDLILAIDDYGNPLKLASAAYGRSIPDPALSAEDQAAQARLWLTYTENRLTNPVDAPAAHRTPLPSETRVFEITALRPRRASALFDFDELRDRLAAIQVELPYQDWGADPAEQPGPARRLIGHTRARYRRDDLAGALPLGVLESRALPYRTYQLAFTASLLADLYADRVTHRMLSGAGYDRDGDTWWIASGQAFYSPDADDDHQAEHAFAQRHFYQPYRFRDPYGNTTTVGYDRYNLLLVQTRDPLGNLVTAGERDADDQVTSWTLDYRVLQPALISDPNRNRSAVAFDALGRVAGTAVMGKPGQRDGDSLDRLEPDLEPAAVEAYHRDPFAQAHELLGRATTRVIYDLDAGHCVPPETRSQPPWVAILARETHDSDLASGQRTRIQHSFSYSDGLGRIIQRKGQAAPGPLVPGGEDIEHRWIGTGWTIYDNKGHPVRSYEPFFTAANGFEFARAAGASSVFFYDPVGRIIAVLQPDHSYAKTVFDPWRSAAWDVNDTLLLDPRLDPDVRGYMGSYLAVLTKQPDSWATWYALRIDGQLGPAQRQAARQTELHAGTPACSWLDSMGRTFLAVVHNRLRREGRDADEFYRTRSGLDVEGNLREVRDALDRLVMRYGYSMTSGQVTHAGMDTGDGGLLSDVTGNPVLSWDARGFSSRTEYDGLCRPVRTYIQGPGISGDALQLRTVYGEAQSGEPLATAERHNQRTRVAVSYDSAGVARNVSYDFKGNLVEATRQLAADYRDTVDWTGPVGLTDRLYTSRASYDALDRPTAMVTPDGSVTIPGYNAASLLDRLAGRLRGTDPTTTFVAHIDYNARGQRTMVRYGNKVRTDYDYDPLTLRLTRIATRRGPGRLQDLRYAYDPVGNPTQVRDDAQQRIFFRNHVVEPTAHYAYDAAYRLTEASGREHLSQGAGEARHPVPPSASDAVQAALPLPGDGAAMARYIERYSYDAVGNLLRLAHRSADRQYGGWTRDFEYRIPSLLQPDRSSNRLSRTGPTGKIRRASALRYDAQGNATSLPGIPVLRWDPQDRLHVTARHARADGRLSEPTYYVYDGAGQRVRKVTDGTVAVGPSGPEIGPAGPEQGVVTGPRSERVYLGGLEIYREYEAGGGITLERESLHVMDGLQRVALVETRTAGTDAGPVQLIRYQLANHLDSAVLELDQQARVISYEEYYPYGGTAYQAVRSWVEAPKRYRFTGKERDTESGLYLHGARYYAPWLARWISCDPAGLVDGVNVYIYAKSQPVLLTDPTGEQAQPAQDQANKTIIKPGHYTGNESQDEIRQQYANLGVFYNGDAVWDEARKSWFVDRSQLIEPGQSPPAGSGPPPKQEDTAGDKALGFAKGVAEGLGGGLLGAAALGFAAGVTGIAASTIGLALLPIAIGYGAYAVATHWDEIKATTKRLASGEGTASDWEAAGSAAGAVLSAPLAGGASELGEVAGQAVRQGVADAAEAILTTTVRAGTTPLLPPGPPSPPLLPPGTPPPVIPRITPGSLPPAEETELLKTLSGIDSNTKPPGPVSKKWGDPFKNWNKDLPGGSGSQSPYQEYRVAPPPGVKGAGMLRVVRNKFTGEMYYTWNHYGDAGTPPFVKIR